MKRPVRVTVWNEYRVEREDPAVAAVYPRGIHQVLADHLNEQEALTASGAALDDPDYGLPDERLEATDVLVLWSHRAHHELPDERVTAVAERVRRGMGLIVLHSAHFHKVFIRLMGTSCKMARWDENGRPERLWTVAPAHPIAQGVPACVEVPESEMYSEPFDVPPPDEVVFISSFEGGEVFRSGCVWRRDAGRVFYFRPGHETYPIYKQPEVLRILTNTAAWLGVKER